MELILLRHGKAEDVHPRGDFERRLVDKGHARSQDRHRWTEGVVVTEQAANYQKAPETRPPHQLLCGVLCLVGFDAA